MKVVVASDKFKGTLSAGQAAAAMREGVLEAVPGARVVLCPLSDGGEGFLEVMIQACGGRMMTAEVRGPLGRIVEARWGVLDDETAIIELAEAAGLALVPRAARDPTRTTTHGVGELLVRAQQAGCSRAIIGLGGSATCDGGAGAMQALGVRLLGERGVELAAPLTGGELRRVQSFERSAFPMKCVIAADVLSPLIGPRGSARTFAPQKGATAAQVEQLEAGLVHWSKVLGLTDDGAGLGAAGGAAAGLSVALDAPVRAGFTVVAEATGLAEHIAGADLIITGEGQLDRTSLTGKVCGGVLQAGTRAGVAVVAVAGRVVDEQAITRDAGFGLVASMAEFVGDARALADPAESLRSTTAMAVRCFLAMRAR